MTKLIGSTARPCLQHFEMQVRAGRAAGRADQRDGLALLYGIADADQHALVVRIAGDVAVAVIDLDHVAVAEAILEYVTTPEATATTCAPAGAGEIDAAVEGVTAGERIGAMPKYEEIQP